jgi:hypothetical protein
MAENEDLQEQAKANNAEQFADSPDLIEAFLAAVVDAMTNHGAMSEKLLLARYPAVATPRPGRRGQARAATDRHPVEGNGCGLWR